MNKEKWEEGKESHVRRRKSWRRDRGGCVCEHLVMLLQKNKSTLVATKDNQLKAKDEEIAAKDHLISAKESEISEKDRGLVSLQQRCGSLQTQLETVQRRNQSLEVSGFSYYIASEGKKTHRK